MMKSGILVPMIAISTQKKSSFLPLFLAAMTADTEAATIDQILPMVRQNLGIGFIPEPLAQEVIEQGIVIQVPLLEEPPVREICFVEDKSSPHSMAANVLKEMLFQAGEKE